MNFQKMFAFPEVAYSVRWATTLHILKAHAESPEKVTFHGCHFYVGLFTSDKTVRLISSEVHSDW